MQLDNDARRAWAEAILAQESASAVLSLPATLGAPIQAEESEGDSSDPSLLVVPFRVMSADTLLHPSSGGMYFPCEIPAAVLQAAAPLWGPHADTQGHESFVPVVADHAGTVAALAGRVLSAEWAEAGDDVPAGVNCRLEFDAQLDAKTHRAVSRRVLRAVSSEWRMDWVPSHGMELGMDFLYSMGEEKDGEIVRAIATEITEVLAVSPIVAPGGDPYSRRLDAAAAITTAGQPAASPHSREEDTMRERACAKLGLTATASEDVVLEAIAANASDLSAIYEASGLTDATAVCAKLIAYGADYVPRSEVEALQAQIAKRDMDAVCASALAEGRATPAEIESLRALSAGNHEALSAYLANRPKNSAVPLAPVAAGTAPADVADSGDAPAPTDLDKKVAAQLGIPVDKVIAQRR